MHVSIQTQKIGYFQDSFVFEANLKKTPLLFLQVQKLNLHWIILKSLHAACLDRIKISPTEKTTDF